MAPPIENGKSGATDRTSEASTQSDSSSHARGEAVNFDNMSAHNVFAASAARAARDTANKLFGSVTIDGLDEAASARPKDKPASAGPGTSETILRRAAENARTFEGFRDQKFQGPNSEFAQDLAQRVLSRPGVDFKSPAGVPDIGRLDLLERGQAYDRFHNIFGGNSTPAAERRAGNPYAVATEKSEQALRDAILKDNRGRQLTPGDVMDIALDQNKNNYPLAALTVHNMLKQATNDGRDDSAKMREAARKGLDLTDPKVQEQLALDRNGGPKVPLEERTRRLESNAELASKLANMRGGPGEKMGPWYHAFAIMSSQALTQSGTVAYGAYAWEHGTRSLKEMGLANFDSSSDSVKRKLDLGFAQAANTVDNEATRRLGESVHQKLKFNLQSRHEL